MEKKKRSGGPRTEAGKARSSQNARKHGLLAHQVYLLENEDPKLWEYVKALCYEKFQPRDEFEQRLVDKIASTRWRMERLMAAETAILAREMDKQGSAFASMFTESDEYTRTALAIQELAEKSNVLELLQRYEAHLERSYQRSVKALFDLRAKLLLPENAALQTDELPNECASEEQPKSQQPTTPESNIGLRNEQTSQDTAPALRVAGDRKIPA